MSQTQTTTLADLPGPAPRRHAVVLTHNRPEMLGACVTAIARQSDTVVVVDNASDPPVRGDRWQPNVYVVSDPVQPPNLARMWNAQLDRIADAETWPDRPDATWDVALLCDDVVAPDDWFDRIAGQMRLHGASAASTHSYVPVDAPYMLRALTNGADRMCPWAFVLRGEQRLRADESLAWWYCDTDLDWQARRLDGTLIAAGPIARNGAVGDWTARRPDLFAQSRRDGDTFHAKWGRPR